MEDFSGTTKYAEYLTFSVAPENENYTLSLGQYTGTAGKSYVKRYISVTVFLLIIPNKNMLCYICVQGSVLYSILFTVYIATKSNILQKTSFVTRSDDDDLNTHNAPRTTHHAPRTTHHAPPTTHHAPRTTHHAPRTTLHAPHITYRHSQQQKILFIQNIRVIVNLYCTILFVFAGDSFRDGHGMAFTTKDRDHDDRVDNNCAVWTKGGWWFRFCGLAYLNGEYHDSSPTRFSTRGIFWFDFTGWNRSLKKTEMKIRPQQRSKLKEETLK